MMKNRKAYLEKAEAQLQQWNAEIEKLKAKAKESKADAELEYQQQAETLAQVQQDAKRQLVELRQATDETWESVKSSTESAFSKLGNQFDKAKATAQKLSGDSIGWPEGLASGRPHDSEGWAEGMGKQAEDSEGWVEGTGKHIEDSEGWPEGMKAK